MNWYRGETELLAVFILAIAALLLLVFRATRRRKKQLRLSRDGSGLWRYHKETVFRRHAAYGKKLETKKSESEAKSPSESESEEKLPVAVLQFEGDMRARGHDAFAQLVDEIEVNRNELSEVVVSVTSPGGAVPHYGHVYSQMERIRKLGLRLTVGIDTIAASGGYLAALPAHKIIAAPFAIIGSVGVVAFVPNFRKVLTRWKINPRTFTAGNLKRTVGYADNATPEQVEHFQKQLETIHRMFLSAVQKYRRGVKLDAVRTGDHWTAQESVELGLGLVDEIVSTNDYLLKKNRDFDLVHFSIKRGFFEDGFGWFIRTTIDQLEDRIVRALRIT